MDEARTRLLRRDRLLAPVAIALLLAAPSASAQRLDRYSVVRETLPLSIGLAKSLTVSCPEGTQVLSGGYRILGLTTAGMRPQSNRPTDDGTGWTAILVSDALSSWGLEVTAVCGILDHRVQFTATAGVSLDNYKSLEATCDRNTRALGAGVEVAGELGDVYMATWGVHDGFTSSTWATTIDSGQWSLTLYLICGDVPDYDLGSDSLSGSAEPVKSLEAVCEPGLVPIGGGLSNGGFALADAAFSEFTPGLDGRGWIASIREFGGANNWSASLLVVCAPEPGPVALAAAASIAIALLGARVSRAL